MGRRLILKNFRIVDETTDICGAVLIEDGLIREVIPESGDFPEDILNDKALSRRVLEAATVIDGGRYGGVLMPAFVDLHAHFRESGFPAGSLAETGSLRETGFLKETLESASLAAAAGGYGTVVCMANTKPVIDTLEAAASLKARADALGVIDLYPVLSLTRGMEGRELSGFTRLNSEGHPGGAFRPLMLSEDGRDVADDALFLVALGEARRLGIPVSCHCDAGGPEAEAAKRLGRPRTVWSRMEENAAVKRAIDLGRKAGCHVHIAHVSTREAADLIRKAKKEMKVPPLSALHGPPFSLSCEATPHHIALTEEAARGLGDESLGRVNPPLRAEEDRRGIVAAILDGTIDAIATDHAPHTEADKQAGAPGFTGLETAFAVCYTCLAAPGDTGKIDLRRLSALMSANPARLLGLDRGIIAPGLRADLVIADLEAVRTVRPETFKSRGKNSPFQGRELRGSILMTLSRGRVVFEAPF
jgi:dihydroorotase